MRIKHCGKCDKFLYEDIYGYGYCYFTGREQFYNDECNLNKVGKDGKYK
jgi:hypothetical protein